VNEWLLCTDPEHPTPAEQQLSIQLEMLTNIEAHGSILFFSLLDFWGLRFEPNRHYDSDILADVKIFAYVENILVTDMAKVRFNIDAFYSALDSQRRGRRIPWMQMSKKSGVGSSTISRMGKGLKPDIDSVASLLTWLGMEMSAFLEYEDPEDKPTQVEVEPLTQITAQLRADKQLSPEAANALDVVIRAAYEELRKLK